MKVVVEAYRLEPMFPLIFKVCVCDRAYKISVLCNILPGLICIWNDVYEIIICKTFLEGTFMCAPSFLVCARLTACVHVHSSKGTLARANHNAHTLMDSFNLCYKGEAGGVASRISLLNTMSFLVLDGLKRRLFFTE